MGVKPTPSHEKVCEVLEKRASALKDTPVEPNELETVIQLLKYLKYLLHEAKVQRMSY